ncbi:MAG: hypothetical protein IJ864_00375 [Alphaproteobacteria bacterium]|nr:hypothetical protein [Alphaproteobacteria bacterium]
MHEKFLRAVAELCQIDSDELKGLRVAQVVDDYILPYAVQIGGQYTRGWRIPSSFMAFMSKWGKYCVSEAPMQGELLMELALQRISKGAVIIPAYSYIASLPAEYQKYTAEYDQPGLLGQAEYDFLVKNLAFCCTNLANETWRGHAKMILKGLLKEFSYDGTFTRRIEKGEEGYEPGKITTRQVPFGTAHILFSDAIIDETPRGIYLFAEKTALSLMTMDEIIKLLAPLWRLKKHLFHQCLEQIDWELFFAQLDLRQEGEHYFNDKSIVIWIKRLFGLYQSMVKQKIKEEIAAYEPN